MLVGDREVNCRVKEGEGYYVLRTFGICFFFLSLCAWDVPNCP